MRKDQLHSIKSIVMDLLKKGQVSRALGMVQGAGIMTNLIDTKMRGTYDEFEQLQDWVDLAVECENSRKAEDKANV